MKKAMPLLTFIFLLAATHMEQVGNSHAMSRIGGLNLIEALPDPGFDSGPETLMAFFPSGVKKVERPTFEEPEVQGYNTLAVVDEEEGVLKVRMRGCGPKAVFPNKEGKIPEDREVIKIQASRCNIIDWKPAK